MENAGELFSDHGFEGVTTRMIAERAGVKLSAIHYHFGSKENLYLEACLLAASRGKGITFDDICAENPGLLQSPAGQAEIVRTTIFRNFNDHFRSDRPRWESKLVLLEIVSPTTAMAVLVEKVFKPDAESARRFYQIVNPEATDREAQAWSDLMYGTILLYSMARRTIEAVRGPGSQSPEYYRIAATKLSRAMCLEAGLPLPPDLRKTGYAHRPP